MTARTALGINLALWGMIICLVLKACSPAGAQGAPQMQMVTVAFTHAEIEANLNLINEAVKALGLSQPQRTQDALMLLVKFQTALKVDGEGRAKASAPARPAEPSPSPPKQD